MRLRYVNAQLWRGEGFAVENTELDVVDGTLSATESTPDKTIDLGGNFVMPSFKDGHCHPLFAGREHVGPDVTGADSVAEIQQILRSYAVANPDTYWIDGAAYDRSIAAQFHRTELDAAVSDRPVILHGADHHTLWVNTKTLELCGLLNEIPELSVGSIDLDQDGVPTGMLREWEAMQIALNKLPALTLDQELDCLDWAQDKLLSLGVTEVQDAWIDPGMAEIYLEAAKRGRLRVKTHMAFRADPKTWSQDFEYLARVAAAITDLGSPLLRFNAIKFFIDGVLGSSTASILEPYVAGPSAHKHGEQVWEYPDLLAAARESNRLGYQLHLHAIGDAAVRVGLDLIEEVSPDQPAVIAHTEMISDQDIPRFHSLDVTANFEPLWAREDGQLLSCVPQLGRDRIDGMYRMRDLLNAKASLSFGSDWPVSSPDPILGCATAVNRSLPGGSGWALDQAISPTEAYIAYTAGVAKQLSAGTNFGALTNGSPADFVVLDLNPFEVEKQKLFEVRVLATSTSESPVTNLAV